MAILKWKLSACSHGCYSLYKMIGYSKPMMHTHSRLPTSALSMLTASPEEYTLNKQWLDELVHYVTLLTFRTLPLEKHLITG